jgi:hypothetical protein
MDIDFENKIYSAVNTITANREGNGSYRGSGHHLAQEITTAVLKAIEGGCVLTCIYCGHEYPQDTPAAGDQVLTDHIKICPKHPLRAAEEKIKRLRAALAGVVGASSKEELESMEMFMRLAPAPEKDKAAAIDAIHALIDIPVEQ